METLGIRKFLIHAINLSLLVLGTTSCANKILKYKDTELLKKNDEFEQTVKIEEVPVATTTENVTTGIESTLSDNAKTSSPNVSYKDKNTQQKKKNSKLKKEKQNSKKKVEVTPVNNLRQPELENDKGFEGRRPINDPFRVGEKVVHSVNYFKVAAGTLALEVKPFVFVNGKKSYQFKTSISTSSLFSSFYSVDDYVQTLVDYETLVPNVFTLHIQETGQLKEARSFFDHENLKATYWEKKVTEKNGKEEKKLEWELMPYAQNVFSAAFYMRNFQWEVGTENAFVVADDEKNLVFKAKCIRKEKLETAAGEFDALVLVPQITLKEKFQPVGDIFIWISDDDRKIILRIESKIKIGTLVSEIIEFVPGQAN